MDGKGKFCKSERVNKPQALKKGDLIGIAAPASPFDPDEFKSGVQTLKDLGFRVTYRDDIFDKKHYLAGIDSRRSAELSDLFKNPEVKAILFARGGYGMQRVLPHIKKSDLTTPKIVLGYSDITTILVWLERELHWPCFYGPVVAKDLSSNLTAQNKKFFLEAITSTKPLGPFSFEESISIKDGITEAKIVGGCLTLINASMGTPFEIDTTDSILFFEDINEKAYAVDRMLTQLKLAGKFDKVRGFLFGNFVNGGDVSHYVETIADVLSDFKGPILYNFPAGHGTTKVTLPLGIKARLDSKNKTLTFLESALV